MVDYRILDLIVSNQSHVWNKKIQDKTKSMNNKLKSNVGFLWVWANIVWTYE